MYFTDGRLPASIKLTVGPFTDIYKLLPAYLHSYDCFICWSSQAFFLGSGQGINFKWDFPPSAKILPPTPPSLHKSINSVCRRDGRFSFPSRGSGGMTSAPRPLQRCSSCPQTPAWSSSKRSLCDWEASHPGLSVTGGRDRTVIGTAASLRLVSSMGALHTLHPWIICHWEATWAPWNMGGVTVANPAPPIARPMPTTVGMLKADGSFLEQIYTWGSWVHLYYMNLSPISYHTFIHIGMDNLYHTFIDIHFGMDSLWTIAA